MENSQTMPGRLQDKIAMVFGAGASEGMGNGKATAIAYAREGAKVVAIDLDLAAAEATRDAIGGEGGEAMALAADVIDSAAVAATVEATMRRYGRIDILHNNVGINEKGGPVELEEEVWDRVMDVNVKSMFLTCKHVLPVMEAQESGAIINISSIAGIRGTGQNFVSYAASKAAVNHFTRAVAMQYAAKNIRANVILPGLMDTPRIYRHMIAHFSSVEEMRRKRAEAVPMKRMGDAWDIAWASVFLASDEARYITGVELCVDGGITCKVA
jgi:NAD(P)-dependent dehydrogenase (short-subunit alcohol dehydrogenase family)